MTTPLGRIVKAGDLCAFVTWTVTTASGGRTETRDFRCNKPAEHHHEWRNLVRPPKGSEWSQDREYYPDHAFVSGVASDE